MKIAAMTLVGLLTGCTETTTFETSLENDLAVVQYYNYSEGLIGPFDVQITTSQTVAMPKHVSVSFSDAGYVYDSSQNSPYDLYMSSSDSLDADLIVRSATFDYSQDQDILQTLQVKCCNSSFCASNGTTYSWGTSSGALIGKYARTESALRSIGLRMYEIAATPLSLDKSGQ